MMMIFPRCISNRISFYRYLTVHRLRHTFSLRDYQEEAITKILDASKRGIKRQAIVMATGGGKTVVFSHLIPLLQGSQQRGNKTLVLAHTQELITQSRDKISRINPDLKVGVEMGRMKSNEDDDVIIASVNSICRRNRIEKFNPDDFKTIIIDECHHAVASSYRKILDYFKAGDKSTDVNVIGLTATLHRMDEIKLGLVFDEIVYERTLQDMINNGELCDFKVSDALIKTLDLTEVKKSKGDYDSASLYSALTDVDINDKILLSYMKMKEEGTYKSTLIFCVTIEHCHELCGLFQSQGIDAQYVSANTTRIAREEIVEDFKNGKIPILCNVGVFTEGTDIPNIDSIILARPTLSQTLKVQMIGRGLRHYPGKTHCHVVDLVGLTSAGLHLKPTLTGMEATDGSKKFKEGENDENTELEYLESLQSIQDRRKHVIKRVLDYHKQGVLRFSTVNGLKIFKEYLLDIEVIKDIFLRGPYSWVLLKNGKSSWGFNEDKNEYLWGVSINSNEYFLTKMIPNAAQPKFILSRHSNTVTDKEGSSSEIESVIITEGVHKLLDTFKENYPKQHQLAKKSNSFARRATKRQVEYIMATLNEKIIRECAVNNRNKDRFSEILKRLIEKQPYVLISNLVFALKYSKSAFYALVKSKQLITAAAKEYDGEKSFLNYKTRGSYSSKKTLSSTAAR